MYRTEGAQQASECEERDARPQLARGVAGRPPHRPPELRLVVVAAGGDRVGDRPARREELRGVPSLLDAGELAARDPDGPTEPELRRPLRHCPWPFAVADPVDERIEEQQPCSHEPVDEDVDVLLGRPLPVPAGQHDPVARQGRHQSVVQVGQTGRREQGQVGAELQLHAEELPALRTREGRGRGLRPPEVRRHPVAVLREHHHGGALGRRDEAGRGVAARRPHPLDERELAGDGVEAQAHAGSLGTARRRPTRLIRVECAGRTSRPVSRILSPRALAVPWVATIHLGPPSPAGSSGLPAGLGRAALERPAQCPADGAPS